VLATLFLVAYIVITIGQLHDWGGLILMLFFASLGIVFRGNNFLIGLSFPVIIMGVASLAMALVA
jgi:BASS family bile acid:Na+ symporter